MVASQELCNSSVCSNPQEKFIMLDQILETFSFGKRFVSASFFYTGLGLLFFAITPDVPSVEATSGCGAGCLDGQICVLIGETYQCQCPPE